MRRSRRRSRPLDGARLHAQALAALLPHAEAGSEEALVAAAGHAIAAAPLVDDEQIAALAEQAAAAVSASYAAGDAARLLDSAVQAVRDPVLLARLRCALGESLQRADRDPEAHAAFTAAANAARRLEDGVLLARAALGSSARQSRSSRSTASASRSSRRRSRGLAPDQHELRSRVQSRLAIELAYDSDAGRRERISVEAVEAARATGEARATAAALGARHVVLWGPDHTRERLASQTRCWHAHAEPATQCSSSRLEPGGSSTSTSSARAPRSRPSSTRTRTRRPARG